MEDDETEPAPSPAPAPAPSAPQASAPAEPDAEEPQPVTVTIETDAEGYGEATVELSAFDVLDARASDGTESIEWDVADHATTKVSLRSEKTRGGTVTVTLDTK